MERAFGGAPAEGKPRISTCVPLPFGVWGALLVLGAQQARAPRVTIAGPVVSTLAAGHGRVRAPCGPGRRVFRRPPPCGCSGRCGGSGHNRGPPAGSRAHGRQAGRDPSLAASQHACLSSPGTGHETRASGCLAGAPLPSRRRTFPLSLQVSVASQAGTRISHKTWGGYLRNPGWARVQSPSRGQGQNPGFFGLLS